MLQKVRSGAVRARSQSYFVFRLAITILVALVALAVSVFVVSFILFSIHESGEQFLLGFGSRGILTFLSLFPWTLLALDVLILTLLEWLLQGWKIGYRVSLLSVFLAIFIASSLLGLAANFTPLHGSLLRMADRGELPIIGDTYESIHNSHSESGIFRGIVSAVQPDRITIRHDDKDSDKDEGTHIVILPPGSPAFEVGERVYVFGSMSDPSVIEAHGVGKF